MVAVLGLLGACYFVPTDCADNPLLCAKETGGEGGSATTASTGTESPTVGVGGWSVPVCGNSKAEAGEECDDGGTDSGDGCGSSCSIEEGYACVGEPSACEKTCGDGERAGAEECDDGNPDDDDGCSSECLLEEATCAHPIEVQMDYGARTFTGSTVGGKQENTNGADDMGPERVYLITAKSAGFLTATTVGPSRMAGSTGMMVGPPTGYDSSLYFRPICTDSTLVRADGAGDGGEVVSMFLDQGSAVHLLVDSRGTKDGEAGSYTLHLQLARGDACDDPVPVHIEPGGHLRLRGATTSQNSDAECSGGIGMGARDVVYRLTTAQDTTMSISFVVAANYDSSLHARKACEDASPGAELDCENASGNGGEAITLDLSAGSPALLWVDGYGWQDKGEYTLSAPAPASP